MSLWKVRGGGVRETLMRENSEIETTIRTELT